MLRRHVDKNRQYRMTDSMTLGWGGEGGLAPWTKKEEQTKCAVLYSP